MTAGHFNIDRIKPQDVAEAGLRPADKERLNGRHDPASVAEADERIAGIRRGGWWMGVIRR